MVPRARTRARPPPSSPAAKRETARDRPQRRAVRPRAPGAAGRGQQPRARVHLGRGGAALHPIGPGRVPRGRRRDPLPGLHGVVGGGHSGTRPPRGARGCCARPHPRYFLRGALAGRGRDRRAHRRARARHRGGALRQLRHRGHHEHRPAGARGHRPQPDRQVQGRLPRACGRIPRGGGVGGGHAGGAVQPGRAGGDCPTYLGRRIQRPCLGGGLLLRFGGRHCRRHRGTGRGQHGLHSPPRTVSSPVCGSCAPATARCSSSTK